MARLVIPKDMESHAEEHMRTVETVCQRQRRRDSVQAIISAVIFVALLAAALWLIVIIPWGFESKTIVTYHAPPEPDDPVERPEMSMQARPKPAGPKSSRAKVIAAALPAPVSVPVPDSPIPEGPFGLADDFGEGFGDNEGDGSGGGGATFFGTRRTGTRIAFVVDYSASMGTDAPKGGGTLLSALKKELVRSIEDLSPGMRFTVIFFSHHAWTLETEGPDFAGNGWNGHGEIPVASWYPGTKLVKQGVINTVQKMPADGNTNWYAPLKIALNMNPPPTSIFLLSDGMPRDADRVTLDMKEFNPRRIPIDTIAFEMPGSPAHLLYDISRMTRGKFSIVYEGKVIGGPAAEKYTSPIYDDF